MNSENNPSWWWGSRNYRNVVAVVAVGGIFAGMLWGAALLERISLAASLTQVFDSDHIYNLTNVWTIHLKFAPEQWEAMEPKGAGNPFGGGQREDVAATRGLAPVLMSHADLNRDAKISQGEFAGLAKKWFVAWDANAEGKLDEAELRSGLRLIRNPAPEGIGAMLLAPEGKRNGIGAALGFDFEYVHADLEFEGRVFKDVGVRYKGNGTFMESRSSLKRSFKVQLNKYVKGQSLDGVTTLNLQNNVTDPSMMNEVLAYRLYRDAGVPAPRTAYARVFVTVPGKYDRQYFGLYSMSEAVDKKFARRWFGTKAGAIFKPVTPSLFTDLGADWAAYNQIYDPKGALYDEQKQRVMELSRLVTHSDDATFAARIGEFIDLPEFARFMAVMVYLSDLDGILGPGQNLYLHLHPKTQQFQFIPWDQDHSWGQFDRASQEQREKLSIHRPWQGENFFLERMFKVEAFKRLYLEGLTEFSRTIFSPERLAHQVDEIASVIRSAVQDESSEKLALFDKAVAGEPIVRGGFGPFGGQTKPIKPFVKARTESIREQLTGKSNGLVAGGAFPGSAGNGSSLGNRFGPALFRLLDTDKDSFVTLDEFTGGFARLFHAWDSDKNGCLTLAELQTGILKDLPGSNRGFFFFGGGMPGPGDFRGPRRNPAEQNNGSVPIISGAEDPRLFMSEHWGMRAFSYKLPNGKYIAKLYFAETYEGITGPGQRVFSFNVQGREFKDFDIWAKAGGPRRAYIETVPVEVTNGEFRIVFTPKIENPAINAIELIPDPDTTTGAVSSDLPIRIKAGLSEPFTDSSGRVWQPDTGFEGGTMSQAVPGFGRNLGGPGRFRGDADGSANARAQPFSN